MHSLQELDVILKSLASEEDWIRASKEADLPPPPDNYRPSSNLEKYLKSFEIDIVLDPAIFPQRKRKHILGGGLVYLVLIEIIPDIRYPNLHFDMDTKREIEKLIWHRLENDYLQLSKIFRKHKNFSFQKYFFKRGKIYLLYTTNQITTRGDLKWIDDSIHYYNRLPVNDREIYLHLNLHEVYSRIWK